MERIAARLNPPLHLPASPETWAKVKIDVELHSFARGTALAYLLRSAGVCFAPRASDGKPSYGLSAAGRDADCWPVGRDADSDARELLPGLFEFHDVNVQNVSAARALEAVAKRLDVPVLLDHRALDRHDIDPAKVLVSLPRRRTTYSLALRKLLFQARLKFQLRRDDAGKPFLWVATIKPL